jgi:hypothetical protein
MFIGVTFARRRARVHRKPVREHAPWRGEHGALSHGPVHNWRYNRISALQSQVQATFEKGKLIIKCTNQYSIYVYVCIYMCLQQP